MDCALFNCAEIIFKEELNFFNFFFSSTERGREEIVALLWHNVRWQSLILTSLLWQDCNKCPQYDFIKDQFGPRIAKHERTTPRSQDVQATCLEREEEGEEEDGEEEEEEEELDDSSEGSTIPPDRVLSKKEIPSEVTSSSSSPSEEEEELKKIER